MVSSVFDLLNDKPTLFIIVGLIFLALAVGVKFSGKVELDPKRQKIAGAVGIICILIGAAAMFYPTNVTVHGNVENWDGVPLVNASIQIGSLEPEITDLDGAYVVPGVPRDATDLVLMWHGKVTHKALILPKDRAIRDYEFPIKISLTPVKIYGTVYDEFDTAIRNARVFVSGAEPTTTASDGYYEIEDVPCTVMRPSSLTVSVDGITRFRTQNLSVSEGEVESGYKAVDVYLPSNSTISIYGAVSYYNGSYREPIPGAVVEIGGTNGTSDPEGKYLIPYVSRGATAYNVTLNEDLIKSGKLDAKLNQAEYRYSKTYRQMINVPLRR